jgi:arylsulfatase
MMEVFAGFVSHTDHHIGRVIDFLEQIGELDNTIIVAISDNGASAEGGQHGSLNEANFFNRVPETVEENLAKIDELGGEHTFNHYPFGWTWAGNTPFQRWKREYGRRRRSVHCSLAGRHRGPRRRRASIRAPSRRVADGA